MQPNDFLKLIDTAGDLDFYAPYRQHRTAWRGTADLVVGFSDNPDNVTYSAFTLSGEERLYEGQLAPDAAVLIIHPGEPKELRIRSQTVKSGNVIQDSTDDDLGGSVTVKDKATGKVLSVTPFQVCYPTEENNWCEGGGGGGGSETVLASFVIHYGDGVGDAEVEYTIQDNAYSETVRFTGVERDIFQFVNRYLWTGGFQFEGNTNVELIETDFLSDDYWGFATYRTADKGIYRPTVAPCSSIGDPNTDVHVECHYPPYTTITSDFRLGW